MTTQEKLFPGEEQGLSSLVKAIIAWYRVQRRALPWRESPAPYHVWISEIMLQQTRIEAVIPYYRRFLEALPTVQALADVDEDTLLKLWEGLGYYSRARNLKKAARCVAEEYGGHLPADAAQLRALPGIGAYTAGAIASIAYGLPEPAVDGNVLRVLMRVFACHRDIMPERTKRLAAEALRPHYPAGEEAALLTEGLMELGEVICLPNGQPKCEICPLAALCKAREQGLQEELPVRVVKTGRRQEQRTVLLLRCRGRYALHRREDKGLLAGLWELPNREGSLEREDVARCLEQEGLKPLAMADAGRAKHIFSHVEWHMRAYFADCAEEHPDYVWVSPEDIRAHYALPTAFRHYAKQIK